MAPLLTCIDCVLYPVPETDLEAAADHYETSLGLERLWTRDDQVGFALPGHREGVGELVVTAAEGIPAGDVNYLVDDVKAVVEELSTAGYRAVFGPESIPVGHVAGVENDWGHEFTLIDFDG